MAGRKTHGMRNTITCSPWAAMKRRTSSNPNNGTPPGKSILFVGFER
jgi:hypothetical protein